MKYSSLSESDPHILLYHSTFSPGFVRNAPITARAHISPYDKEGEARSNLIYKHSISYHVNT
jgi:hypothetical protein